MWEIPSIIGCKGEGPLTPLQMQFLGDSVTFSRKLVNPEEMAGEKEELLQEQYEEEGVWIGDGNNFVAAINNLVEASLSAGSDLTLIQQQIVEKYVPVSILHYQRQWKGILRWERKVTRHILIGLSVNKKCSENFWNDFGRF